MFNPSPNTSASSISHPSQCRSLKLPAKNFALLCFFFSSCIPQESYKSLCSSCFLCKSKDELELIKRKLRGHTEVLGSVKGGGSSSGAGIVAVERNVELYRHTHTPHLGSI